MCNDLMFKMVGFFYCLFIASFYNNFSHALVLDNECPHVEPIENFNFTNFGQGVWHEIARYPNEIENTNCGSFEFLPQGDKVYIKHTNDSNIPEDSSNYVEALCEIYPGAGTTGILLHNVKYGNPQIKMLFREIILFYDDEFYISYECNHDKDTDITREYGYVMSRSKTLENEFKEAVDIFIKSSEILEAEKFIWLDNSC